MSAIKFTPLQKKHYRRGVKRATARIARIIHDLAASTAEGRVWLEIFEIDNDANALQSARAFHTNGQKISKYIDYTVDMLETAGGLDYPISRAVATVLIDFDNFNKGVNRYSAVK